MFSWVGRHHRFSGLWVGGPKSACWVGWGQVGQHQIGVPEIGNHVLLGCTAGHCGLGVVLDWVVPNKRVGLDGVMVGGGEPNQRASNWSGGSGLGGDRCGGPRVEGSQDRLARRHRVRSGGLGESHLDGEDERGEAEAAEVGESEARQDVEEGPEDEVAGLLVGEAGEGRPPPGWVQRDAHLRLLRLHGREQSEDGREVGALRETKPSPAPPLSRPPGSQSSGEAAGPPWARRIGCVLSAPGRWDTDRVGAGRPSVLPGSKGGWGGGKAASEKLKNC